MVDQGFSSGGGREQEEDATGQSGQSGREEDKRKVMANVRVVCTISLTLKTDLYSAAFKQLIQNAIFFGASRALAGGQGRKRLLEGEDRNQRV